jgi:transposase, IS5 family
VAVTAKEGLVVGMRSMPGNPYVGHTVDSQFEQVEILTDVRKRGPKALLTRGRSGQTSTTCRSSAKPTRQLMPSPGSMVAVR